MSETLQIRIARCIIFMLLAFCSKAIAYSDASSSALTTQFPTTLHFQQLLADKQLAAGVIQDITQDNDGFIWIGADEALLRYDGYEFVRVAPGFRAIYALEAIGDDLWIGTSGGLFKYDKINDVFHAYSEYTNPEYRITAHFVLDLETTANQELLVATAEGLTIIDLNKDFVKSRYTSETNPELFTNEDFIWSVEYGSDGSIWLGCTDGVSRIYPNRKKFENFQHKKDNPASLSNNRVQAIVEDKKGNLWIGTENGLNYYDLKTKKFKRYIKNDADPNSLSENSIWDIKIDNENFVWVGTDQGGINIYDPNNDHFHHYKYSDENANSISSNVLRSIFFDKLGDVWLGHYPTGITYLDNSSKAVKKYTHNIKNKNSLSHDYVWAIQEDKHQNLWIGTDGGGLNYFDRQTNQFTHYRSSATDKNTPSSDAILDMHLDRQGILWFTMWAGGLNTFDPEKKEFFHFPIGEDNNGTSTQNIWQVFEDKQGIIWLGTHSGGLNRFDPQTKKFTYFKADEKDPESLASDIVWAIFEDSKNRLWVGGDSILHNMDRQTGKFKSYRVVTNQDLHAGTSRIFTIFEDSQNKLIAGTAEGLYWFNEQADKFELFSPETSLAEEAIRGMLEDEEGRYWIATNNGIIQYKNNNDELISYRYDDIWQKGRFSYNAALKTSRNEFVFGGDHGFTIFSPQDIKQNINIPEIAFTEFRLFTTPVKPKDDTAILNHSLNFTEFITLNYRQNMFAFEFASLNYRSPEKNQYAYRLHGFDDDWRHIENDRKAIYTNIDPGEYVFQVKGSNNDNVWNEDGVSIKIIQRPPPWRTWWAHTIYTLLVLGSIFGIFFQQIHKRKKAEMLAQYLEVKVKARTAELQQKNNDIQNMLRSMTQGLFTIEDHGKIHREYSKYLEEIFETKNIEGQDYEHILFRNCSLDLDDINRNCSAINSIIGNNAIGFDFNLHLLATEMTIQIGSETPKHKILELAWNPILEDDTVTKLMVTVRDVTKIRKLEKEAQSQRRELDIISQILHCGTKRFLNFSSNSDRFIKLNQEELIKSEPDIEVLFRNMHTLKGNARVLELSWISEAAHIAENCYAKWRQEQDTFSDQDNALQQLKNLRKVIEEYTSVCEQVLNQGSGNINDKDFHLGHHRLDKILSLIPDSDKKTISRFLDLSKTLTLEEILNDLLKSLPSLAAELNKQTPEITFDSSKIRFRPIAHTLLSDVFTHIFRNSIDHGIEASEERNRKGKPERGQFTLSIEASQKDLILRFKDDGQGLDMSALYKKGIDSGRWLDKSEAEPKDIANLIFSSGLSTKNTVSEISGRGVGMDAVKRQLIEAGGDIHINLLQKLSGDFSSFELLIKLPKEFYIQLD